MAAIISARQAEQITELSRKVLWLSSWMIHNANHVRANIDGLKVGGHQASSASMATLLSTLYFGVLNPADRVAVKPHASPAYHAIQYLLGRQTRDKLEAFRAFGGAQSYPSRTKDSDDVDFSTGSVGLGVAFTAFASLIQDYVRAKPWARRDVGEGRMIALAGDAELDEGNVYECLLEGWKHGLRNTWWIIDYNRQSLDGIVHEGLYDRIEAIFRAFDWNIVTLKYGAKQRRAFAEPGGERLKAWIDSCPNDLYSAMMFRGGAAWRARLEDEIGDQGPASALLKRRSDAELAELMANLGGHCVETLLEQFNAVTDSRPTAFIAYTVKGWGTPLAGHKDNHAGQMTAAQMEQLRTSHNVRDGHEWDRFEGLTTPPAEIERFLSTVPFISGGSRRHESPRVPTLGLAPVEKGATSTQAAFGRILDWMGKSDHDLARRIVTTSPDVTVSTNLGAWVNRRQLFARREQVDRFQEEKIPSTQKWQFAPQGQHIELGIAETNLMLLLGAAGLSHSLFGERLLPVGTLYDPFVARGLDALNYACYQDARFILVGTPSGVSLAAEGGAHQSIAQPLIGMGQDGLAAFEPAFADELATILDWSFDYLQRDGEGEPDPASWLRDDKGGSVYLRLTTRAIEQPERKLTDALQREIVMGGYWLVPPSPQCEVVVVYQGVVAAEAINAAGLAGSERRNVAVLAVTSADRLNAGWHAALRQRRAGRFAQGHVERLLAEVPAHCTLVTVIDGHPATLAWLGGVRGHRVDALGVEHFGQSGTVPDLYAHFGIDTRAIGDAIATAQRQPHQPSAGS